jgi:hypothetical protein
VTRGIAAELYFVDVVVVDHVRSSIGRMSISNRPSKMVDLREWVK